MTMLKMKQGLALMMVLCFAVLAACGQNSGNANSNTNSGANATDASTVAPTPTEPVTIEFWYGLGGKLGDTMKEKIELFNSSQDEVIVKGIAQADYTETGAEASGCDCG
jgi:multiple sugar transport system substrate-binding protein